MPFSVGLREVYSVTEEEEEEEKKELEEEGLSHLNYLNCTHVQQRVQVSRLDPRVWDHEEHCFCLE